MLKVKRDEIDLRTFDPKKDFNFLLATWLKSYRQSEFARQVPNDVYFNHHQLLIGQILRHPDNDVLVLCDPEDSDQILGYIVYSTAQPVVYYSYIKFPLRKFGLGQFLFNTVKQQFDWGDQPVICTHKCRRWAHTAKKHNLVYNPYIIGS